MNSILLIEDDDKVRKMISLRLQLQDYDVDTAVNGLEGYQKALKGQYDVLLMDMHMPIMDGHEAVKKLRKKGYRGLIIAVTASVMSDEADKALLAGCDYFIAKPLAADFEQQIYNIILHNQQG
jgi:CheY-like chemotaxis protein